MEDSLEEGMTTHSSILAWKIPWTEESGGLQSMGLQRVRHDWSDWACVRGWAWDHLLNSNTSSWSQWTHLQFHPTSLHMLVSATMTSYKGSHKILVFASVSAGWGISNPPPLGKKWPQFSTYRDNEELLQQREEPAWSVPLDSLYSLHSTWFSAPCSWVIIT